MCLFHVLGCWWLDPKSTSSEGRRLHIQAVPVRSAHRTAGQGGGVPDYAPHEWTASVMGRHVLGCCAMVLLARLESTSSEGRSCHTQSVPVRSAHRTAVHGGGLGVAAFPLPRGAHAAVACLSVLSSHFLGMCTGFPRPKSLFGVLWLRSGSRIDGLHVFLTSV